MWLWELPKYHTHTLMGPWGQCGVQQLAQGHFDVDRGTGDKPLIVPLLKRLYRCSVSAETIERWQCLSKGVKNNKQRLQVSLREIINILFNLLKNNFNELYLHYIHFPVNVLLNVQWCHTTKTDIMTRSWLLFCRNWADLTNCKLITQE